MVALELALVVAFALTSTILAIAIATAIAVAVALTISIGSPRSIVRVLLLHLLLSRLGIIIVAGLSIVIAADARVVVIACNSGDSGSRPHTSRRRCRRTRRRRRRTRRTRLCGNRDGSRRTSVLARPVGNRRAHNRNRTVLALVR